ncbi:hypothetical protein LSM04_001910 [Trypanosoma melophagium]|uniref:uncharacterized protein n=1 Tax=Trypanosoma melophagium TaxID=715481 RepID=UPI00351A3C52|nr:hypothetical protein LSM04_001910 [Trypanosoma melophagium]
MAPCSLRPAPHHRFARLQLTTEGIPANHPCAAPITQREGTAPSLQPLKHAAGDVATPTVSAPQTSASSRDTPTTDSAAARSSNTEFPSHPHAHAREALRHPLKPYTEPHTCREEQKTQKQRKKRKTGYRLHTNQTIASIRTPKSKTNPLREAEADQSHPREVFWGTQEQSRPVWTEYVRPEGRIRTFEGMMDYLLQTSITQLLAAYRKIFPMPANPGPAYNDAWNNFLQWANAIRNEGMSNQQVRFGSQLCTQLRVI